MKTINIEPVRKTIVIAIGNSDDKLTQKEWAHYTALMKFFLSKNTHVIHAENFSAPASDRQNATFVAEVYPSKILYIRVQLAEIAAQFRQDSIALMIVETIMVPAKEGGHACFSSYAN